MIRISSTEPHANEPELVGEFPDGLYLAGRYLLDCTNQPVASFRKGLWRSSQHSSLGLRIEPYCFLRFTGGGSPLEEVGPFDFVLLSGMSLWSPQTLLARYEQNGWLQPNEDHIWPIVFLQQVSRSLLRVLEAASLPKRVDAFETESISKNPGSRL